MTDLELIWDYQQALEKQNNLERQLKKNEHVSQLRALKTEIEGIQGRIREMVEQVNEKKKQLKVTEDLLVVIKDKIEKATEELYGGKVPSRELDSAERNIAILRGKAVETEEKALAVLETIEELEDLIKHLKLQLEEKKAGFRKLNKTYSDNKTLLLTELQEINLLQEKLIKRIKAEDFEEYRKFSARFPDHSGIAELQNGICSGCHMGISFEKIKMSKNSDVIATCDHCGRWLLFK